MTDVRFVEAVGFGSGFALGAVQSGMQMVGKVERPDAFGAWNALSNRHLLGNDWELQVDRTNDGYGWDSIDADVVLGNPPCSGFSLLTQTKGFRGIDSPINVHMHALIEYAARVKPQIVMFESVQGAYTQGLDLMRALREKLADETGETWSLTHVLHNNLSLGGIALRRRYFFVASRVPFGVEKYPLRRVPKSVDAFRDLEPLADTWEPQPYRSPPTVWSKQLRSDRNLVDGHATVGGPGWDRALDVALNLGGEWPPGDAMEDLCRRHYKKFGRMPGDPHGATLRERGFQYIVRPGVTREQHLFERDFTMGPTQLSRWLPERHGYVITGGALGEYVHPTLLRTFTHREAARIMGFPDDWLIRPHRFDKKLGAVWGKGVPVHSGQWIAQWAKNSIEGNPGEIRGDLMADANGDERVIDVTHDWKRLLPGTHREYLDATDSGKRQRAKIEREEWDQWKVDNIDQIMARYSSTEENSPQEMSLLN